MIKSNSSSSFDPAKQNDFLNKAFEVTSSYLSQKLIELEISDITTKASLQNLKESLQIISNELNELINEEMKQAAEKKELSLSDLIKKINIEKIENMKPMHNNSNHKSKSLEKGMKIPNHENIKQNQDLAHDNKSKKDASPPKTSQLLSKTQNLSSIKEEKENKTLKKEISKKLIQKDLYMKYFSNPSNDKKLTSLISRSQTTRGRENDKNGKIMEDKRSRRNLEKKEERKDIPKIKIISASCDTRSKSLNNKFLNYYYFFDKNSNKVEN